MRKNSRPTTKDILNHKALKKVEVLYPLNKESVNILKKNYEVSIVGFEDRIKPDFLKRDVFEPGKVEKKASLPDKPKYSFKKTTAVINRYNSMDVSNLVHPKPDLNNSKPEKIQSLTQKIQSKIFIKHKKNNFELERNTLNRKRRSTEINKTQISLYSSVTTRNLTPDPTSFILYNEKYLKNNKKTKKPQK